MNPRIYLSPPDVSELERQNLVAAFDSNWIAPLGPWVDAFEASLSEHLAGTAVCITSSGTAALHLALILLGVTQGDEVVVPTLTFAATANAVCYVGARPVFVDAEAETWALCPNALETLLAERVKSGKRLPKVVITVDLYGQPANYERIRRVLALYDIPILQDAAEAVGSSYRGVQVGVQGDFGVLSFNGNKIITTSGGGALVSANVEAINHARKLASQAREPATHYEHTEIGYNYRLSNLLAAVGVGQLASLDAKVSARRAHNRSYKKRLSALPGWAFFEEPTWARSNYWLTVASIDQEVAGYSRDDVIARLAAENIEARPTWKPMHLQPVFQGAEWRGGGVAEGIFRDGVCLPSGSKMTDEERMRVEELIVRFAEARRP
jgi:dTDP-4-amino-4,6-dideoxygalactose transaminase